MPIQVPEMNFYRVDQFRDQTENSTDRSGAEKRSKRRKKKNLRRCQFKSKRHLAPCLFTEIHLTEIPLDYSPKSTLTCRANVFQWNSRCRYKLRCIKPRLYCAVVSMNALVLHWNSIILCI